MRWKKIFGFGCLGLLAVLVIGGGILWYLKPWQPPIEVAEPGPTGQRIAENGLLANYFAGVGEGPRPAILLLGGSEGGIGAAVKNRSIELQKMGYSVLNISYFRAPGQNEKLELIPLEYFDTALAWLKSREGVDPKRIAVWGGSKGAEAALVIASRHPELRAVVAGMPSNVVWAGVDWNFGHTDSSWSKNGKPVPHLPYAEFVWDEDVAAMYRNSLKNLSQYPDAVIKIERAHAPILLICGEKDTLWPSCDMARAVEARAKKFGQPDITLLAYKDAGHGVAGKPRNSSEPSYERLGSMGGSPDGNNEARKDNWPKTLAFLKKHLAPEENQAPDP